MSNSSNLILLLILSVKVLPSILLFIIQGQKPARRTRRRRR